MCEKDEQWLVRRWEQDDLERLSTYARHLDRQLEWWEIDAILAVSERPE